MRQQKAPIIGSISIRLLLARACVLLGTPSKSAFDPGGAWAFVTMSAGRVAVFSIDQCEPTFLGVFSARSQFGGPARSAVVPVPLP